MQKYPIGRKNAYCIRSYTDANLSQVEVENKYSCGAVVCIDLLRLVEKRKNFEFIGSHNYRIFILKTYQQLILSLKDQLSDKSKEDCINDFLSINLDEMDKFTKVPTPVIMLLSEEEEEEEEEEEDKS